MISALFIFNAKGEILISRLFRPDVKRALADVFRIQVLTSTTDIRAPIHTFGSTSFFHIKHNNVVLVAVTKTNAHCSLVFEVLYKIVALGAQYLSALTEESIKNNFVLVYELLDEIIDAGFPQNTDSSTLTMLITTEGVKSESAANAAPNVTVQATGAVGWRAPNIRYRRNEAFIDVVEAVNVLASPSGEVLRSDVTGKVLVRAYLSGMPECKFGLNNRLLLENGGGGAAAATPGENAEGGRGNSVQLADCQFHQCVRLARFDAERVITFIPPDGEFELMRYRASEAINQPFRVTPVVTERSRTRVDYKISIRALFATHLYAQNVIVRIPTPPNTAATRLAASAGKAKYLGAENCIAWKILRVQGGSDIVLTGEADLSATVSQKTWSRPPISLDFEVLMFTASGLFVRFFKVFEKSNYQSIKWVRYTTRAGVYQIRF